MEASRTPARVDLCGPLRVEIDGERLEGRTRGRQGRLLFAYLVLHRHAPVSRERLTDALWSGELPADPSGVLNTLLSGLRRTLGEGRLQGRRELRIDLGPDAEVDVETAVSARDAALAALARSEFAVAAGAARTALGITRQELLAGDAAEWVDRLRDDMSAVRADALEALARASIELGGADLANAVTAATELVQLEPYRESAYALLMEAHAARGNVAVALRVFDGVRTLLRDELGTTPSPPLLALHQRLLSLESATGEEDEAAEWLPLPAPLARDAGFVGREASLERLRSAFAAAGAGERRFVMVAGDPGIGKTTLAARFAREAHAAGAAVLYGRSSEEPLLSYEPFVEALCHYIGTSPPEALEPAANPELEELGRWMPDLGRPMSEQAGPLPAEPDARRYRMFEAMSQLLARIGRDRPLVFVFDDLHWADGSALRLLRHVARATRPTRLLVIATYRDAELAPAGDLARLLGDVRREAHLEEVSLAGLDDAETAALITTRGGVEHPRLAARLRELTAGNPYFLEEVLRAVVARDGDEPRGDPLAGLELPRAVSELIERRLARLPEHATRVLGAAAVLGMVFRLPVLEAMEGSSEGAVLELLEAAVAARLVVELPGEAQWFSFAHALVRTVLYESMSRTRRLRLHRKAGEVLEARRAELSVGPAELAEHFFAARELGEGERALRYAEEAGAHAGASLAYEDAARHFGRALAALDLVAPEDEDRRCRLLLELGEAQTRAGAAGARETFARAAAAARGRSPERLAEAAIGFSGRYFEAGVVDEELVALLEEALAALPEADSCLRARMLARLGEALHFAGDPPRAVELTEASVAMARRMDDADALAGALAGRHVALLHIEHLDERLAVSAELSRLAHSEGRRELAVQAHHARLYDVFELGDVAAAHAEHDELKRQAAELRQPLFRYFATSWAAVRAQMEGRFDEAEDLAVELLGLQQELGARDAETVFAARIFALRREQGRLGELLPVVEGFTERFPDFLPLRAVLPLICLEAGDPERARAELRGVGAALPRDFFWLSAMAWIGEAAARLGDLELLREVRPQLEPYADRTVQLGFAACLGSVERVLGLMAAAEGDRARARGHLERALDRNGALGGRALIVRSQSELAAFLMTGEPGEEDAAWASELADSAATGARALGMDGLVSRSAATAASRRPPPR